MIEAINQTQENYLQDTSNHLVILNEVVTRSELFVEEINMENVETRREILISHGPFTKEDLLDFVCSMFEQSNIVAVSTSSCQSPRTDSTA